MLSLKDSNDYRKFCDACKKQKEIPIPLSHYVHIIGILKVGEIMFKNDEPLVRFNKMNNKLKEEYTQRFGEKPEMQMEKGNKKQGCQECLSIRKKFKQIWYIMKDICKLFIKKIKTGGTYGTERR